MRRIGIDILFSMEPLGQMIPVVTYKYVHGEIIKKITIHFG